MLFLLSFVGSAASCISHHCIWPECSGRAVWISRNFWSPGHYSETERRFSQTSSRFDRVHAVWACRLSTVTVRAEIHPSQRFYDALLSAADEVCSEPINGPDSEHEPASLSWQW